MNYSKTTTPFINNLSPLPTIVPVPPLLTTGISYPTNPPTPNPSISGATGAVGWTGPAGPTGVNGPTQVRLLSLSTDSNLTTDVKTTFTRINVQEYIAQFAIYKSDLNNPSFIPPGIWDMNIFAEVQKNSDSGKITLQYHLYTVNILLNTITAYAEVNLGSSIETIIGGTNAINLYTLSLVITQNVDLSTWDALYIIIVGINVAAVDRETNLFFEGPATYSHIHTTFGVYGYTGPTGPTSIGVSSFNTSVSGLTPSVGATGAVTLAGTVNNAGLTNSTISGISLGSNLANLSIPTSVLQGTATTYNGSSAVTISSKPPFAQYRLTPVGVSIAIGGTYAFLFANGTGYNGMPTLPGGGTTPLLLPQTGYYKVMCRSSFIYNTLSIAGTGSLSIQTFINGLASLSDNIGYVTPTVSYGVYPASAYFSLFAEGIVYVSAVDGVNNALTCNIINNTTTVATIVLNFANVFKISD